MKLLTQPWRLSVERGPACLYVKVLPSGITNENDAQSSAGETTNSNRTLELRDATGLGDQIWHLMTQHLVCRVVIELDQVHSLSDSLNHELFDLGHRIEEHQGFMKLCGMSPAMCEQMSRQNSNRFLQFASRCDAVLGDRPKAPHYRIESMTIKSKVKSK